jgi:uncharacterized protein
MAYFALLYETVDDFIARRAVHRDEHLRLAREAHARGELLMAGAFANPPDGALLIFESGEATTAEAFARNDPYVKNGLVTRWKVRSWSVVIGAQESRAKSTGND